MTPPFTPRDHGQRFRYDAEGLVGTLMFPVPPEHTDPEHGSPAEGLLWLDTPVTYDLFGSGPLGLEPVQLDRIFVLPTDVTPVAATAPVAVQPGRH